MIAMESETFSDALIKLIYSYFVIDITYPKELYPILNFIQCFIMGIKDGQPIPSAVTQH